MSASESQPAARRLLGAAVVASVLALLVWVGATVLMSGRGLDVSDEGFYLLSYRWWDSTPRAFSGVQYVYGPVLQLLGDSLPALRLVRLVTIVATHAVFGWSVVSWLRARYPERVLGRQASMLAVAAITLSGAVLYGWLPQSPGYNDVSVLSSLVIAAALLRSMRAVLLGGRLPVLPAVAAGTAVTLLAIAKWSSAVLVVAFVVAVAVVALRSLGARGWLRYLASGLLAALVLAAAFVAVAGSSGISAIVEVNRLAAETSNSPTALLRMYLSSSTELVGTAVLRALPALLLVLAAWFAQSRGRTTLGSVLLVAAPAAVLLATYPERFGIAQGGASQVRTYTAVLIALTFLVAGAAVVSGRTAPAGNRSDHGLTLLLLALPVVGAAGTGNDLYALAVNAFGCWTALAVIAVSRTTTATGARLVAVGGTAAAVLVAVAVGVSGLLENPYRTAPFNQAGTILGGTGITAGIRVSHLEATSFRHLRAAVGPIDRGAPVIAFDEMAGLVLALDARSVGEAWYSAVDHHRAVAGIRATCAGGNPWGGRLPVVLFDRPAETADRAALATCGVDLDRGYQVIDVSGPSGSLRVYRPEQAVK